jgi:nicotinamide-nucleotide amidase
VVAYNTELKHTIVGVDAALLAEHGPVHPEVARQMASRIRVALAIGGVPADVGLSTTGVAGPGGQGGQPAGTVYIGVSIGDASTAFRLELGGDRQSVRSQTVDRSLKQLSAVLDSTGG